MMTKSVKHLSNVRVESYKGLTIAFARSIKATALVRGLRMSSDFEREFEMSLMNKKVAPDIESIFLMASLEYQFLSSSLLKEVATLGGSENIKSLVPPVVLKALKKKNLI
jgi:pantetheine-phosphate adenylyltransferase